MDRLREFLKGPAGRGSAIVVTLLLVGLAIYSMVNTLGRSDAERLASDRWFVCSETRKPFLHTIAAGESVPLLSPHSGKNTGYPAELCYWTKDGKIKQEPTPVLLNLSVGEKGPTFCPDCGRLVVPYNPRPNEGDAPPPTKEQHAARAGGGAAGADDR